MKEIPRPIPDQSAIPEFKYLSVHTSSNNDENDKKRISDNLSVHTSSNNDENDKKRISIGSHDQILRSSSSKGSCQSDAITEFSSKFIVDEKLVKNYIERLSQLQSVNEIRKQEQRKEKQVRALKDVHCYDWKTLVEKG